MSTCLILFAANPYYLYAARFLAGFGGAGAFIFIPLFVSEIAEDNVRGSLGSLLVLSCNIGILIAFIIGNYLTYTIQLFIHASLPILFFVSFAFFPESPQYLMKIGKEEVKYNLKEKNIEEHYRYCAVVNRLSKKRNRKEFNETISIFC